MPLVFVIVDGGLITDECPDENIVVEGPAVRGIPDVNEGSTENGDPASNGGPLVVGGASGGPTVVDSPDANGGPPVIGSPTEGPTVVGCSDAN